MSVGSTLLELQEIDLTLMRDKEQLQNLPEIAELARRRKLYIKLKGDVTKYFAQRKDVEIDLQELDSREQALHDGIAKARREVDMDDYRQVQQLEITLSTLPKSLIELSLSAPKPARSSALSRLTRLLLSRISRRSKTPLSR